MCHQKHGQIGGRDSLGDCDNIFEGNLVFRVIFGKFMHRWFQICAQLGSCNVFFSHYRPPRLKYCFFRGSFARLTSQSQAGTLSRSTQIYGAAPVPHPQDHHRAIITLFYPQCNTLLKPMTSFLDVTTTHLNHYIFPRGPL